MDSCSSTTLIINGLVALGTLLVAAVAIWGGWFQAKLAPPKLVIRPHTLGGDLTWYGDGSKVMLYHLKVSNERGWSPARNCRVLLTGLSRRGPDGLFHTVRMAVPFRFVWAPAETMPATVTLVNEQIFDFGRLAEGDVRFMPALDGYPNNFQGYVQANEAVRFHLQIDASNFVSPRYQVFEVAWDGKWSDDAEKMAQHLRAREIVEA